MSLQVAQVVYWADEPERKRMVLGLCGSCARSRDFDASDYELLSPAGTAHVQAWDSDKTLCGRDATGEQWWWPE